MEKTSKWIKHQNRKNIKMDKTSKWKKNIKMEKKNNEQEKQ